MLIIATLATLALLATTTTALNTTNVAKQEQKTNTTSSSESTTPTPTPTPSPSSSTTTSARTTSVPSTTPAPLPVRESTTILHPATKQTPITLPTVTTTTTVSPVQVNADQTQSISEMTTFSGSNQEMSNTPDRLYVQSANQFALNFLKNYPNTSKGNFVFSPLSLHNTLDMVLMGTVPQSKSDQQLRSALGYAGRFDNNSSEPHKALQQLTKEVEKLHSEPELSILLKNLLLVNDDTFKLEPEYEKELTSFHDVRVEKFSRAKLTTKIDEKINDWVKNNTNDKIKTLVNPSDVEGVDAVFLNAAFFKGKWLQTFKASATQTKPFYNHGDEKTPKDAKFMSQQHVFGYVDFAETSDDERDRDANVTAPLNCSVLSLPFSLNDGQDVSMVFFLPTKKDGLDELVANLNETTLNFAYKYLVDQQVMIELPKFTFETATPANEILMSMGLKSIFNFSTDLGKMSGSPKVESKVDKVIHKAQVTVDETGASAAAASGVTIFNRNFVPMSKSKFVADHPFLFVIKHNKSNVPLFVGRVTEF